MFLFGSTSKLCAQIDLDIVNNTVCSYSVIAYFDDGLGNCANSGVVAVPAGTSFTITNPWGTGFCTNADFTECGVSGVFCGPIVTPNCALNPTAPIVDVAATPSGCPTCGGPLDKINNVWTGPGGSNALVTITSL